MATALGKHIMKVPTIDPTVKVTVVIIAAALKWTAKVPMGMASVLLQLEGAAESKDQDEDVKNNAYWIACFAYL